MIPHIINSQNDFIRAWTVSDDSLYDDLITYSNNAPDLHEGMSYDTYGNPSLNNVTKTGLDCNLFLNRELCTRYLDMLQSVLNQYMVELPYSNFYSAFTISENIVLCKYRKNDGFKTWHCERGTSHPTMSKRHLTFMTYLNDISDAGETEFVHQNIKIKPSRGTTVIWPSDWTHTHRGIPSPSEEKYIVTGWWSFV